MVDLSQLSFKFGLVLGAVFLVIIFYWVLQTIFLGKCTRCGRRGVWVANIVSSAVFDTSSFVPVLWHLKYFVGEGDMLEKSAIFSFKFLRNRLSTPQTQNRLAAMSCRTRTEANHYNRSRRTPDEVNGNLPHPLAEAAICL